MIYVKMHENSGVLLATCEGMKHCTGDIIAFLDGDDIWERTKVSEIVKVYLAQEDTILVSHDYSYMNGKGIDIYKSDNSQKILYELSAEKRDDELCEKMRKGIFTYQGIVWLGSAFSIQTKLFNVSSFIEWVTLLPDPRLTYQDWPIAFYAATTKGCKLEYVPKKLFKYRIHDNNDSGASKDTVDKALKNATKGLNTRLASLQILTERFPNSSDINMLKSKVEEYYFLISLYKNNRKDAFYYFIKCSKTIWTIKDIIKNSLRLVVVFLLGANTFFKLKNGIVQ